jgi:hypothetical protein
LFKERQSTMYNGRPLQVAAGVFVDMVWDIALRAIDPKVVKAIKPGAHGLTSRLQDKDTGQITARGNLKLTAEQKRLLREVREGEALAKRTHIERVKEAQDASKKS